MGSIICVSDTGLRVTRVRLLMVISLNAVMQCIHQQHGVWSKSNNRINRLCQVAEDRSENSHSTGFADFHLNRILLFLIHVGKLSA